MPSSSSVLSSANWSSALGLPSPHRCTWVSIRPGSSVVPGRWVTSQPEGAEADPSLDPDDLAAFDEDQGAAGNGAFAVERRVRSIPTHDCP